MTTFDLEHLNQWIGKSHETHDPLWATTARQFNVTLNRDPDEMAIGKAMPPAWHWLYFHEETKREGLGEEGHPKLGGFMPPVNLPRRMWAGGKLTFRRPLLFGQPAIKRATIESITPKEGRSGTLCFVVVAHEISQGGNVCLEETQTIVYRSAPTDNQVRRQAHSAPTTPQFSTRFTPDPVLLFRYSALTFNSHRIHYDIDYCRQTEGYPDLVVHGPLTATLLLDLFNRQFPNEFIQTFSYRGRAPLFNPHPFTVNGTRNDDHGTAWAADHRNELAMEAEIHYS